jgi:hypothetical protein
LLDELHNATEKDKTSVSIGGEEMTEEKLKEIARLLTGLKAHEWAKICRAVQNVFDWKYAHLEIDDAEKILTNLKLEIGELDTD